MKFDIDKTLILILYSRVPNNRRGGANTLRIENVSKINNRELEY